MKVISLGAPAVISFFMGSSVNNGLKHLRKHLLFILMKINYFEHQNSFLVVMRIIKIILEGKKQLKISRP